MAGMLYYLPGHGTDAKLAHAQALGLGYALERFAARLVTGGPDGGKGVVVADDRYLKPQRIGYYPDRQIWQQVPDSKAWAGYYKDDRPTPAELARKQVLPGHPVELGDGQTYIIPIARGLTEEEDELVYVCRLPQSSAYVDGAWQPGGVMGKYAKLWELANAWWDAICKGAEANGEPSSPLKFGFDGLHESALVVLSTNYRVGIAEAVLLGLLNEQCATEILQALIDWPVLMEFQNKKKEQADGSPFTGGPSDDTKDTAPQ